MRSHRDTAVAIATRLFQKLFERVWLPWSPTLDRAVERLVDSIIGAAVEQLRRQDYEQFLRELDDEAATAPPQEGYTGQTFRMTRRLDPDEVDERQTRVLSPEEQEDLDREGWRRFVEWKRRRAAGE